MDVENIEETISETHTVLSKFLEWSQTSIPMCRSLDTTSNFGFTEKSKRIDYSNSDSKERLFFKCLNYNGEPLSILEIIDEKNKEISSLKKQICNQKLQLKHYLNKNLLCEQVIINGSVVNIAMPEENDCINIAMTRFNKINNRKSRMIRVYDKINSTECRLFNLLRKQETILRKVTLDILSAHSEVINEPPQEKFGMHYSVQLDLLSRLLTATVAIKRDINILKTYLKRLVAVEEERNALVDHIFRLPPEQRLNGHYLLSIERENAQLCNELENIRKDQMTLKQKISQIHHEDEILKETTRELKAKAVMPDFSDKLNNVIHAVEIETESLVTETNEERQKYLQEIEILSLAKQELEEKLSYYVNMESEKEKLFYKCQQLEGKCLDMENHISALLEEKEDYEHIKYQLAYTQNNYTESVKINDILKERVVSLQMIQLEHINLCEIHEKLTEEHNVFKQNIQELENVKYLHDEIVKRCPEPERLLNEPTYFQVVYDNLQKKEELEKNNQILEQNVSRLQQVVKVEQLRNAKLLQAIQEISDARNLNFPYENDLINIDKKISEKPIPPDEYGDRLTTFSNDGLANDREDLIDANLSTDTTGRHIIVNNSSMVCQDSEIAVVYHDTDKLLLTPPVTSTESDSRDEKMCRMCASVPQDLGSEINSVHKSKTKLFNDFKSADDKFNTTKDDDKNANNGTIRERNENVQESDEKNELTRENNKEHTSFCSAIKGSLIRGFNKNNSKLPIRNLKQKESEEIISVQQTQKSLSESIYTHPTLSTVTILTDSEKIDSKKKLVKEPVESSQNPLEIVNGMSVAGITDSIVINPDRALNELPQIPLNDIIDTKVNFQTDSNIMQNEQHIRTSDLYPSKGGCCPKCEINKEKKNHENKKHQPLKPKLVEHKHNIELKVPEIINARPKDHSTLVKEIEKNIVGREKNSKKLKNDLYMKHEVSLHNLNFD